MIERRAPRTIRRIGAVLAGFLALVVKGVSWALRAVGRRNRALNHAAVTVARRLSASPKEAARWVGRDALRELTSPAVTRRLATQWRRRTPLQESL